MPDVDPTSQPEVTAVLDAVVRSMGTDGLADLLARLPGVVLEPAQPRRLLSAGRPARVWVGPEDHLELGRTVERVQVVGGVELHRQVLRGGELPGVVAGLVLRLARAEGSAAETSLVLTAARDAAGS